MSITNINQYERFQIARPAWYRFILPQLLTYITGKKRRLDDEKWMPNSWMGNTFIAWRKVAWRPVGVRPSMSAAARNGGKTVYAFHTWEAALMWGEHWIRSKMPRLQGFKLHVPIMVTPQGIPVFASPYLFAVTYDTTKGGGSANNTSTTATISSFVLASGGMLTMGVCSFNPNTVNPATAVWNTSENFTAAVTPIQAANGTRLNFYYIAAPTSGTHDITVTFAAANGWGMNALSVTGQAASPLGNVVTAADAGVVSSFSQALTTGTANSLIVDFTFRNGTEANTATQTGQTLRLDYAYTNASGTAFQLPMSTTTTTTAGSYSIGYSWPTNTRNWTTAIIEIKQLVVVAATYTETVTLSDTLTRQVTALRTEAVTLTDTIIRSISRTISEAITAADTFLGEKIIPVLLTEVTTLSDTLTRQITALRTETATLTDTFVSAWTASRTFVESMTLTDTFARVWTRVLTLTETLTLTDTIKKLLNGSAVIWSRAARHIATWRRTDRDNP